MSLPSTELAEALVALWTEGDAALPLDPELPRSERFRVLGEMRPARLITSSGTARLPGGQPVEPGIALVVLTSGTTGRPRGVELTHDALKAAAVAGARRLELTGRDRWLCCLPLHHIAGLQVLIRSLLMGTTPVIHDRFNSEAIARTEDANLISLVPTMLLRLLDAGADLARFKRVLVGGAAAAPGLVARARDAGATVVQTYGMTETCGGVVYDGLPLDGVDISIAAGGVIEIGGPVVMRGYRNLPSLSASVLAGGRFHTSDIGVLDADGRVRVLGRADDVIVTGGEKVVPAEVASILCHHPDVLEAEVIGIDDEVWGRRVVAVVVAVTGTAPTLEELRAHVLERAAPAAAPRELVLVERLPRLPSGKVDRAGLGRLLNASR